MSTLTGLSTTSEAKCIVRAYMEEHAEADRKELSSAIKAQLAGNPLLTEGVIAGAIKVMVTDNELEVIARGRYRKGSGRPAEQLAFEKIYSVCERFGRDLNRVCTVNLMSLTEKEKLVYAEYMEKLLAGKQQVEEMLSGLDVIMEKIRNAEANDNTTALPVVELHDEKEKTPVESENNVQASSDALVLDDSVEVLNNASEDDKNTSDSNKTASDEKKHSVKKNNPKGK